MNIGVTGFMFWLWITGWICVLLLLALSWWGNRKRRRDIDRFGKQSVLYRVFTPDIWHSQQDHELSERGNQERQVRLIRRSLRRRRNSKLALFILAMICLVMAAGKPRWGNRQEEIFQEGIDLVLAVDSSFSMKAEDTAPNRLEKAKSEVAALLERITGNRVALIGFATTTRLHCPLTLDFRGLRSILDHSISLGPGTNLENAVQASLRLLATSEARGKAIVVISDGEHHEGDVQRAIETARSAGIRIFTLGVGTPEGGPIPESGDARDSYKKQNGELVWTRLEEEPLKTLSRETGGKYFRATAIESEIDALAEQINGLEKTEFSQTVTTRKEERFGIFIFLAIIFLALESVLGDYRRLHWERSDD